MMSTPWIPRALTMAPRLDPNIEPRRPKSKLALLINPFYPKDPHASFGKHVLTPSLALTSIAGATPADWEITYWGENLLQGPPPWEPFPQVVGITVHLTFAVRAYELGRGIAGAGPRSSLVVCTFFRVPMKSHRTRMPSRSARACRSGRTILDP